MADVCKNHNVSGLTFKIMKWGLPLCITSKINSSSAIEFHWKSSLEFVGFFCCSLLPLSSTHFRTFKLNLDAHLMAQMLQLAGANVDMSMSNDSVCVCVCVLCACEHRCVPERQRVKEKCTCAVVRDYCSMYICVKEREVRAADGRCCHTALDSSLCDFSSEAQQLIATTCWQRKHGCWMKSDVKISKILKRSSIFP